MKLNLKAIRREHGMTQRAVADYLGVHFTSVCYWESGKRAPNVCNALRLAKLFKCKVEDLYTEDA